MGLGGSGEALWGPRLGLGMGLGGLGDGSGGVWEGAGGPKRDLKGGFVKGQDKVVRGLWGDVLGGLDRGGALGGSGGSKMGRTGSWV